MDVTRKVVEHEGSRLAYDVRGEGPPILFIQGVGVHGDGWLPQVEPLSSRLTCITFDNRGMGRSQPADSNLTVDRMIDDSLAVLTAAGFSSAHIVGHSLGGLVALGFALSKPERVRSLSLLCTFPGGRAAAPLTLRMIWAGSRTRIGTRKMRRRGFLRLIMPAETLIGEDEDAMAERLAPLFGHDLADQPAVVDAQLKAMRASDMTDRLGELKDVPTLVVTGTHDPIAPPRAGRMLAEKIAGARYVEYGDASHGLPIQWADRVNALLVEHLAHAEERWPSNAS
ncbi:alpha/beta fold hydrolase [Singulisphaera sp. PoT]|uniref:alpha/beta fold hydrolase n=1 Tax=Singulisphaera sp. PoT TaxID=3411797 RepID=UPI003BF5C9E8